VAAGNAHLSAIVICGGLIEHERSVLLCTKQIARIERSEIALALRDSLSSQPAAGLGGRSSATIEKAPASVAADPDLAVIRAAAGMLLAKSAVISVSCELPARWRRGLANKSRLSRN
jgi:hypothetical protein